MTVIALNPPTPKKWDRVRTNNKTLAIAIVIELIIVGAVLFASYQFANAIPTATTCNGGWRSSAASSTRWLSWRGCRWPSCAATHRKWYARWLAIFMLMFAVVITTKSLSQIGEQMFSQRLVEVHKAQTALEIAEANNRGAIEDDAAKRERIEALDAEIESLIKQLKEFGKPPEPKQVCSTDARPSRSGQELQDGHPGLGWRDHPEALTDARTRRNAMDGETVSVRQGT